MGEIAAAVGRPIRFVQITPEEFVVAMRPYVADYVGRTLASGVWRVEP